MIIYNHRLIKWQDILYIENKLKKFYYAKGGSCILV